MAGPLQGLTIVEMAGLGPGPFAAMMLADHGARVIRVERPGNLAVPNDPLTRNRDSIALDLRKAEATEVVRRLCRGADGLIESYRPGVMERLGLGPEVLLEDNPRLIYGRMAGWSRTGPMADRAGHDINYLAVTGLLHAIGERGRAPVPPLNLVADYAGGAMMLAFGMVSALLAREKNGAGQVVEATMTDGAALIGSLVFGMRAAGLWSDERGSNLLDGGDPFYGCYRCADGRYLSIGAIEPKFRATLCAGLGIEPGATRAEVGAAVAVRTRDEWVERFDGQDACIAPVLSLDEASAGDNFIDLDGVRQPAPTPVYSTTGTDRPRPPRREGEDGPAILQRLGYSDVEIAGLRATGALL